MCQQNKATAWPWGRFWTKGEDENPQLNQTTYCSVLCGVQGNLRGWRIPKQHQSIESPVFTQPHNSAPSARLRSDPWCNTMDILLDILKQAHKSQHISCFKLILTDSGDTFFTEPCLPRSLHAQTHSQLLHLTRQMWDEKRQWTSDLSLRQQGKLCSLGATRVHHPLCHSSPQCLTLPSHKTPVKTSCSPFYGCQMVGRPSCLWTCLPSLVKPVDLGHIKTAVYEKAWDKTHKHPASETIHSHLISQRALLQDEGRLRGPWLWAGEVQM